MRYQRFTDQINACCHADEGSITQRGLVHNENLLRSFVPQDDKSSYFYES